MNTKTSLAEKIRGTSGSAGLGTLRMAKVIYNFGLDGGAAALITPKQNVLLPKNAVIVGGTVNSTTAAATATTANITLGTSAGSSASALLGSTAHTSFSTNALQNLVPVFATPVKLSAKGYVTLTPSAALTAGVFEIVVYYYVANA